MHAARLPGFRAAFRFWRRDFSRDLTPNRVRRFGQAAVLARELPAETEFLYVHFLHTPGSVARYAAMMRGLKWGFSAHAKDIWTLPDWEMGEKLADCEFGVTCTAANAAHLRTHAPCPERIDLVYHGLDLRRFPEPPPGRDGESRPVALLSVGRLVEKKGYDDLLEALALLPPDIDWRFRHIGGGELKSTFARRAAMLGIAGRIEWLGKRDQRDVIEEMRAADIFVLPSKIAEDGDRDGLPNVLMEAASQDLPILSTRISAIPEFISDGFEGALVESGDPAVFAARLTALIRDPDGRAEMAKAARARLVAEFGMKGGIDTLETRLAPYRSGP